MSMPDNDIDNLFRSKLENFEAEPSTRVWEGISEELQHDKRRRMVPIWSIAASVILFVAAGLYFVLPQQKVNQTSGDQKPFVSNPKAQVQPATATPTTDSTPKAGTQAPVNTTIATQPVQQIAAQHTRTRPTISTGKEQSATQAPQTIVVDKPAPVVATTEQLMAANTTKVPVSTPVVPDASVPLSPKTITADAQAPVMASTAGSQATKTAPKRHGAFTLGDLINTVVATVDKRADKVIEFTDTDDEQSNITGINLGIIKIKKNNNK